MFKTDDLKYLRADVRTNCEIFLQLCHDAGLPVKVTETVRDEEYQLDCVRRGTASKKATKPTFHSIKAGLAFDICKNVSGHAYDDAAFFVRCGQIGKQVGFSWGGDWRSFPDRPHFQWDANGRYSGSMILGGKYPPKMEEYDYMNQATFDKMMDTYLAKRALLRPVDQHNADPLYAEMEQQILDKVNASGVGPQGLGGTVTALACAIEPFGTHIAGLPCVVNISCHVTRHAEGEL